MDEMKIRKIDPSGTEVTLDQESWPARSKRRRVQAFENSRGDGSMSVKLSTREVDDVTVVDVSGRITLGEGAEPAAR